MNEIEEKTARVASMLGREGLDGVILNSQHNFAWLTGGKCNAVDSSRENGAGSILITAAGKRYILANNIEMPRLLAEEISESDFEPIEFSWQDEKANSRISADNAVKTAGIRNIASDIYFANDIPVIEGLIGACRQSLLPVEIERYRSLGTDTAAAMSEAVHSISPGMTEIDAANILRSRLAKKGTISVITLAAADERIAMFRHPVPTDKKIGKKFLLVTCAKRLGLIASVSRMVGFGTVDDDTLRRTEAAANVHAVLLDATQTGATGSEIYEKCAAAYADNGFPDEIRLHHQGGAAGYKSREWVAHPGSTDAVRDHQAFAWNPSVTGTKVEDTYLWTNGRMEAITSSPEVPAIVNIIGNIEYRSPGIISL